MDLSELSVKPENLGAQTRTAVLWKLMSQGCTTGLQMVTSIILARLLMPKDFGIVAMAAMVSGLAGLFQDLGMGLALVQRGARESSARFHPVIAATACRLTEDREFVPTLIGGDVT